ncbi:MAG: HyaD/HybD family hydrogenase maturation endopeptidase [Sulfuricellaceae bacterium]|nr:HyaD/HybD family hydrogenase maturation endopeptidase [Sulfuricellaceae bacterium]
MNPTPRILVLGIGNTLLQDEGVGIHAMRQLQLDSGDPDDVEFLDGGTLSFTLAGPIGDADALVVVDAAQLREAPGTVRVFQGEAMDRFLLTNHQSSVHEVGLSDLMTISRLTGHWPERRALVAIQPEIVDWGESTTPAVSAAIPEACRQMREVMEGWRRLD